MHCPERPMGNCLLAALEANVRSLLWFCSEYMEQLLSTRDFWAVTTNYGVTLL